MWKNTGSTPICTEDPENAQELVTTDISENEGDDTAKSNWLKDLWKQFLPRIQHCPHSKAYKTGVAELGT